MQKSARDSTEVENVQRGNEKEKSRQACTTRTELEGPPRIGRCIRNKSRNSSRMDDTKTDARAQEKHMVAWIRTHGHMDAPSLRRAGQVSPQKDNRRHERHKDTKRDRETSTSTLKKSANLVVEIIRTVNDVRQRRGETEETTNCRQNQQKSETNS